MESGMSKKYGSGEPVGEEAADIGGDPRGGRGDRTQNPSNAFPEELLASRAVLRRDPGCCSCWDETPPLTAASARLRPGRPRRGPPSVFFAQDRPAPGG
ncbi:unnamed protein product [Nesidiocoris tenuis]|uniref:Uncharacterized protein n=1 Tax=Nesidiocoris tenuis TaxID=355587 RepID=A0A6H5G8M9_9HEMI|nr:unnamed protein product [Nesidiocoris tenuis]